MTTMKYSRIILFSGLFLCLSSVIISQILELNNTDRVNNQRTTALDQELIALKNRHRFTPDTSLRVAASKILETPAPTASSTPSLAPTPKASPNTSPSKKTSAVDTLPPPKLANPTTQPVQVFMAQGLTIAGIVIETNKQRAQENLPPLTSNALLNKAAANRVTDLLEKQYFSHTSPDGTSYTSFINATGYIWSTIGENLASGTAGHASDAGVLQMWMNSEGHKKNILKPEFTEIGIGIGEGIYKGEREWFAVQLFGSP